MAEYEFKGNSYTEIFGKMIEEDGYSFSNSLPEVMNGELLYDMFLEQDNLKEILAEYVGYELLGGVAYEQCDDEEFQIHIGKFIIERIGKVQKKKEEQKK